MEREDPYTKEMFIPSRSNQVYASRENQIKHNNSKAREKRLIKKEINSILDKNRASLERLLDFNESIVVTRSELLREGFNFVCQTHIRNINNKEYIFIYEFGYTPLNSDQYEIIKYA